MDTNRTNNHVADHLSRMKNMKKKGNIKEIDDAFPGEQLLNISRNSSKDIANFLACDIIPEEQNYQ